MINNLIEKIDLHDVQDSTKIQDYMTCPRLYFYRFVLGYKSDRPIHALEFGIAWHLAKEVLFNKGYSNASVDEGMEAFEKHYRQSFPEETDMDYHPKSPGNADLALRQYCIEFQDDEFEVLHTEIGVTMMVSKGRVIYGKMDSIVKDPVRDIMSIDSKSQGAHWSYLEDSYQQKFQMMAYNFFLYSYYPADKVYGVVVDATVFKKTENEHFRVPILVGNRGNFDKLESWLWETEQILDDLDRDFDRLADAKESDIVMKAFPRRTESCVKYNKICPLFHVCHVRHNPLQKLDLIPAGYKIEHWDPRRENIKVHLKAGVE